MLLPCLSSLQVLLLVARHNKLPRWETSTDRGLEVLLDSVARVRVGPSKRRTFHAYLSEVVEWKVFCTHVAGIL